MTVPSGHRHAYGPRTFRAVLWPVTVDCPGVNTRTIVSTLARTLLDRLNGWVGFSLSRGPW